MNRVEKSTDDHIIFILNSSTFNNFDGRIIIGMFDILDKIYVPNDQRDNYIIINYVYLDHLKLHVTIIFCER